MVTGILGGGGSSKVCLNEIGQVYALAASDFSVAFWGLGQFFFSHHIGHGSTPARSFIQATNHTSRSMEVRLASYFATGHLVAVGTATQVLRWSDVASGAAGGSRGGLRLVHLGRLERLRVDEKWPVETWVVWFSVEVASNDSFLDSLNRGCTVWCTQLKKKG